MYYQPLGPASLMWLVIASVVLFVAAAVGHTGELEARFRMQPAAMKKGATGPKI